MSTDKARGGGASVERQPAMEPMRATPITRVAASFSMAPPGEDGSLEASMGFELYDYGVATLRRHNVVAPPLASDVPKMPNASKQGG
jgi:hypothetical protein